MHVLKETLFEDTKLNTLVIVNLFSIQSVNLYQGVTEAGVQCYYFTYRILTGDAYVKTVGLLIILVGSYITAWVSFVYTRDDVVQTFLRLSSHMQFPTVKDC